MENICLSVSLSLSKFDFQIRLNKYIFLKRTEKWSLNILFFRDSDGHPWLRKAARGWTQQQQCEFWATPRHPIRTVTGVFLCLEDKTASGSWWHLCITGNPCYLSARYIAVNKTKNYPSLHHLWCKGIKQTLKKQNTKIKYRHK